MQTKWWRKIKKVVKKQIKYHDIDISLTFSRIENFQIESNPQTSDISDLILLSTSDKSIVCCDFDLIPTLSKEITIIDKHIESRTWKKRNFLSWFLLQII